jgi:CelD/BcsL family acetyltransferase involved in cellulose biosynthesis
LRTGTSPPRIEVVNALDPLVDEWRDLAERAHASPFLYPGWFQAWWPAFGSGKFQAVTARRGAMLVGLVPMQLRRGVWGAPTNAHTPGFDLLAVDEEILQALAEAVFSRGARVVAIGPLDARGAAIQMLGDAARASGYHSVVRPAGRAPYLRLVGGLGPHERSLSRNLRHDVQRRMRRLCEAGTVSVQVSDGSEDLHQLLEEGLRVEQRGWKGKRGTAIASDPRTKQFYTALAGWAASAGWLRLAFLRLDGRPIAFQLDLEVRPAYYSLKIGYDPEYERFSPGKLLAYTMLSRAVAAGSSTYELLGTDEPWKDRWTDDGHERLALRAFSSSPAGRLALSAFVYGRPLVRRLPLAVRIATAVRR